MEDGEGGSKDDHLVSGLNNLPKVVSLIELRSSYGEKDIMNYILYIY